MEAVGPASTPTHRLGQKEPAQPTPASSPMGAREEVLFGGVRPLATNQRLINHRSRQAKGDTSLSPGLLLT